MRLPFTLPVRRRVPACMIWLICGCEDCSAGKRPKTTPLSDRETDAEKQDRQVDVEVGFVGIGVSREASGMMNPIDR